MVRIEIINCCNSVKELYDSKDGSVGGYGHIVFDDGNLEDAHIRHCLYEAINNEYEKDICDDTRIKSIIALTLMLSLNYVERNFVYHNYEKFNNLK
jgi:hypothetical protein